MLIYWREGMSADGENNSDSKREDREGRREDRSGCEWKKKSETARSKASGSVLIGDSATEEASPSKPAVKRQAAKKTAAKRAAVKSTPAARKRTPAKATRAKKPDQAEVVQGILDKVVEKLSGNEVKATLGDYIRLVQLQKELEEDVVPKEIKVTWVEPAGGEPVVETLGDKKSRG